MGTRQEDDRITGGRREGNSRRTDLTWRERCMKGIREG